MFIQKWQSYEIEKTENSPSESEEYSGQKQFINILEFLARAIVWYSLFLALLFPFVVFFQFFCFILPLVSHVICIVRSTLSNWQFTVDWLRDPKFPQISRTFIGWRGLKFFRFCLKLRWKLASSGNLVNFS